MRVLLDECLPRGLARDLTGHEVQTVPQIGWSGVSNGEIDQGFTSESPVPGKIALVAESNRLASLRPLVPDTLNALRVPRPGERIRIGG